MSFSTEHVSTRTKPAIASLATLAVWAAMVVTATPAAAATYPFSGFRAPIVNPPSFNTPVAGAAVTLKFGLGGDLGLGVLQGQPTVRWIDCASKRAVTNAPAVQAAGSLTFDHIEGTYAFRWATAKAWGGTCQRFELRLTDGTSHRALFRFGMPTNENLLVNAGFERGSSEGPAAWFPEIYLPTSTLTRVTDVHHWGAASAKIASPELNDVSWRQTVTVLPNTLYRVTGWIKTADVAHSPQAVDLGATVGFGDTWTASAGAIGNTGWTRHTALLDSGSSTELTVAARLGFWSGTTTGTTWFDDLRLTRVLPTTPAPSWRILTLIYGRTDIRFQDPQGVSRHVVGAMTQTQKDAAAAAARAFITQDIPALDSGLMIPTITIRFPRRNLTQLDPMGDGVWPSPANTRRERDPSFDAVIVIWIPDVVDQDTGERMFIGSAAGLTPAMGTGQTYTTLIVDAATTYGHRNVFKHEFGHSILSYFAAVGTAPEPAVDNHTDATQYAHCPTGGLYVWVDETLENPVPNSIYNNASGFTHDYYSGTTALAGDPMRCLGVTAFAWSMGGPVSG